MRKIFFLMLLPLFSFAQRPDVIRGMFYDIPGGGLTGDSAICYRLINRADSSLAGFVAINGNDTVFYMIGSDGNAYIIGDSIYLDGKVFMQDVGVTGNLSILGELSTGDTATIAKATQTPIIIGGNATTSDLTFQTTTGVGATGADMHFLVGNNGGTEALTLLNSGKTLVNYNFGVRSLDPLSNLAVVGSNATNLNMFNFVDSYQNKNRTTIAQATDTCSFNFSFTPLGRSVVNLLSSLGTSIFKIDSFGRTRLLNTTESKVDGLSSGATLRVMSASTGVASFVSTANSSTSNGGRITIGCQDGALMGSGHVLGVYEFSGGIGANTSAQTAYIGAITESAWGSATDLPTKLVFATNADGCDCTTEKMTIAGNGNITYTSNLVTQDSLSNYKTSSVIAAGDSIILPASSGWGTVFIDSSGVRLLKMDISFDANGTTYIDNSYGKSYIFTSTTSTAGKVCFYDGGSSAILRFRLAYGVKLKVDINY
jgi:hypothetical protein